MERVTDARTSPLSEIDLLAAGLQERVRSGPQPETVRVTDSGIAWDALSFTVAKAQLPATPHPHGTPQSEPIEFRR